MVKILAIGSDDQTQVLLDTDDVSFDHKNGDLRAEMNGKATTALRASAHPVSRVIKISLGEIVHLMRGNGTPNLCDISSPTAQTAISQHAITSDASRKPNGNLDSSLERQRSPRPGKINPGLLTLSHPELWDLYRESADPAVRNSLVEAYLPIVSYHATRLKKRLPPFVEIDDLISVGTLGLIQAIDQFDISKGIKFETFCAQRIRGSMLDYLRGIDHASRSSRKCVKDHTLIVAKLTQTLGRRPFAEEIAGAMGMDIASYHAMEKEIRGLTTWSIDTPFDIHSGDSSRDDILDDRATSAGEYRIWREEFWHEICRDMRPTEKNILLSYFVQGMPMNEIAKRENFSESRISQILKKIVKHLRGKISEHGSIDAFLEVSSKTEGGSPRMLSFIDTAHSEAVIAPKQEAINGSTPYVHFEDFGPDMQTSRATTDNSPLQDSALSTRAFVQSSTPTINHTAPVVSDTQTINLNPDVVVHDSHVNMQQVLDRNIPLAADVPDGQCPSEIRDDEVDEGDQSESLDDFCEQKNEDETESLLEEFNKLSEKLKVKKRFNDLDLYIMQAAQTPILSIDEEYDLAMKIQSNRLGWRRSILENFSIQLLLWEDYQRVCNGDLSIFKYSKHARASHHVTALLQNSADETRDRMISNRQRIGVLLEQQREALRKRALHAQKSKESGATADFVERAKEISTLLEAVQVKDSWFEKDTEEHRLSMHERLKHEHAAFRNQQLPDAVGKFLLLHGETPDELQERITQLDTYYRAWQGAKQTMIKANLRLVISIAKRYRNHGHPFLDLIQDGNIGLIKSIDKFEPERGLKFSTSATHWIKYEIRFSLSNSSRLLRLPSHRVEHQRAIRQYIEAYVQNHEGAMPTDEEIASALHLRPEVVSLLRSYRNPKSLHAPLGNNDDDNTLGSIIPDIRAQTPNELADLIDRRMVSARALSRLSKREQNILLRRSGLHFTPQVSADGLPSVSIKLNDERYGHDQTLDEIGLQDGRTRERIRQIERRAVTKLQILAPEIAELVMTPDQLDEQAIRKPLRNIAYLNANPTHDVSLSTVLSSRTSNTLMRQGILTVYDLLKCTQESLLSIRNFGATSISEVNTMLEGLGLPSLPSGTNTDLDKENS